MKNIFFFFSDLSEGMENCKKSGKNQGKVREFQGGWQVAPLVKIPHPLGIACQENLNRKFQQIKIKCVPRNVSNDFLCSD